MRRALWLTALLVVAGCNPMPTGPAGDPTGSTQQGGKDTDDPDDPEGPRFPREPGSYRFAVSADSTHPGVNTGPAPEAGPLDLYLWLVTCNLGLSALECDIGRNGADLADAYFTPAENVLFLTWEGSGEVDLAVGGCPYGGRLLGTIRLVAHGGPLEVSIIPDSEFAGAVDCHPIEPWLHAFECTPFVAE